jgi:Flp pilus assembly protein TadG
MGAPISSGRRQVVWWRRLLRDRGAASATEFAAIAPVLMLLFFGVVENGLVLFMQSVLDNATRDAARLTMTGQAQGGGTSFATQLCNDISVLMRCSSLQYRIQTGSSFGSISPSISGSSSSLSGFTAYPSNVSGGSAGDYVLVQVVYTRSYLVPIVGAAFGNGNPAQLLATSAYQNEPY